MSDTIFTVSQVSAYISKIIDSEYLLKNISISGEVTNASMSGGYIYFNVKDEQNSLPCVCFDKNYAEMLKNGAQVIVVGSVSYYGKSGKLSFIVRKVTLNGEGLLYKKFLELKEKLEKQGLFDQKYKKPIPKFVKRIGVVSSNTGAVIRDIINVTRRRNDTVDIVLYPVKVQGVGAEEQIAQGINFFSDYQNVDVVIVARGGGSFEDLMPFNSEIVATSAFQCKKPLISAVGHETDFTLCDFAADKRAGTPSIAAELLVPVRTELMAKVEDLKMRMVMVLRSKGENFAQRVDYVSEALARSLERYHERSRNLLQGLERSLSLLSPYGVLDRGYSLVTHRTTGRVVKSSAEISPGEVLDIRFAQGSSAVEVRED